MFDWLYQIPKESRGPVYAAFIVALASFITVILTFIVKDYFIPVWLENRRKRKENKNAYAKYKTPLLLAVESLNYRLQEIFTDRSFYLQPEAPATEFYSYKYNSTVYRLCAVIGWMRAIQLETINLVMPKHSQYTKLDNAVKAFGKSLADGQHIEILLVTNLCDTWGINIENIDKAVLSKAGCEIDNVIQEANFVGKTDLPLNLSPDAKLELMKNIRDKIALAFGMDLSFDVGQTLDITIKEISIRHVLIYRDWQQAIGDIMIERNEGSLRFYDIIGYRKFEAIYTGNSLDEKKWLNRVERLFSGVDINLTESRFDSRIAQLKQIQNAGKHLIAVLATK